MTSKGKFFERADYYEYVRLLAGLHVLIAAGQDERPDGERLRDDMDACSEHFSDEEIASLNGISADLYSLMAPAAMPRAKTRQAQQDLLQAMLAAQSRNFVKALDLLRRDQAMIEPSLLSYMRGQIFADAGLEELAHRFFEHAAMKRNVELNGWHVHSEDRCLKRTTTHGASTALMRIGWKRTPPFPWASFNG